MAPKKVQKKKFKSKTSNKKVPIKKSLDGSKKKVPIKKVQIKNFQ